MTKEVAAILKRKLTGFEFFETVAGIVQPVIDVRINDTTNIKLARKMPVSYDLIGGKSAILGAERQLVPNEARKSIIYFEDFGSNADYGKGIPARANAFVTRLRLVVWLNKKKFGAEKYKEITAITIDTILKRLVTPRAINEDGITRLFVKPTAIPIQDAGIFSRYNYDEAVLGYLRPPFEYFAIDLECRYWLRAVTCTGHEYQDNFILSPITALIVDAPNVNATQLLANGDEVRKEYAPGPTLTIMDKNGMPYLKGKTLGATFIVDNGYIQQEAFNTNTGVIDHSAYGGFSSSNNPGVVTFDVNQPLH